MGSRVRGMDPMPDNGRCRCGSVVWYVRAQAVGGRGHFHCRRYRFSEEGTLGADVGERCYGAR